MPLFTLLNKVAIVMEMKIGKQKMDDWKTKLHLNLSFQLIIKKF